MNGRWQAQNSFGAFGGVREDLYQYALNEIALAKSTPLAGINAEVVPAEMTQTATNKQGAGLKSAYWLARAARLLGAKGDRTRANGLLAQAQTFVDEYAPSALSNVYQTLTSPGGVDDPAAVSSVFHKAAILTHGAGVSNVTEVLKSLGSIAKIEDKQSEADTSPLNFVSPLDFVNPWAVTRKYKKQAMWVGTIGLGLTVLLGLAAYSQRAKLAAAAKALL